MKFKEDILISKILNLTIAIICKIVVINSQGTILKFLFKNLIIFYIRSMNSLKKNKNIFINNNNKIIEIISNNNKWMICVIKMTINKTIMLYNNNKNNQKKCNYQIISNIITMMNKVMTKINKIIKITIMINNRNNRLVVLVKMIIISMLWIKKIIQMKIK